MSEAGEIEARAQRSRDHIARSWGCLEGVVANLCDRIEELYGAPKKDRDMLIRALIRAAEDARATVKKRNDEWEAIKKEGA